MEVIYKKRRKTGPLHPVGSIRGDVISGDLNRIEVYVKGDKGSYCWVPLMSRSDMIKLGGKESENSYDKTK